MTVSPLLWWSWGLASMFCGMMLGMLLTRLHERRPKAAKNPTDGRHIPPFVAHDAWRDITTCPDCGMRCEYNRLLGCNPCEDCGRDWFGLRGTTGRWLNGRWVKRGEEVPTKGGDPCVSS